MCEVAVSAYCNGAPVAEDMQVPRQNVPWSESSKLFDIDSAGACTPGSFTESTNSGFTTDSEDKWPNSDHRHFTRSRHMDKNCMNLAQRENPQQQCLEERVVGAGRGSIAEQVGLSSSLRWEELVFANASGMMGLFNSKHTGDSTSNAQQSNATHRQGYRKSKRKDKSLISLAYKAQMRKQQQQEASMQGLCQQHPYPEARGAPEPSPESAHQFPQIRFCPVCGSDFNPGFSFCRFCGTPATKI
jgi:hypothetical protein